MNEKCSEHFPGYLGKHLKTSLVERTPKTFNVDPSSCVLDEMQKFNLIIITKNLNIFKKVSLLNRVDEMGGV